MLVQNVTNVELEKTKTEMLRISCIEKWIFYTAHAIIICLEASL